MKTTIDIPENELRDAMRFTRATTKREAVVKVLEEFNRRRRMAELTKYSGTFSDRFPTNDEIEAVDAKRDRHLNAGPRRYLALGAPAAQEWRPREARPRACPPRERRSRVVSGRATGTVAWRHQRRRAQDASPL